MWWILLVIVFILVWYTRSNQTYETMGQYGTRKTLSFNPNAAVLPINAAWDNDNELSEQGDTLLAQKLTNGAVALVERDYLPMQPSSQPPQTLA
jgi:hypothetical protein